LTFSAKNWKTKNLPTVLEALSICRQQLQSNFQIVVTGPSEGFCEAQRERGTKIENVVLTEFVSTADLSKLYRGAQVFLIGSKYEGFGLPLLEAMSCGCAVISSNGGSLPEVAGSGAIVVEAGDAPGMARSVARLLSDPEERRQQQARSMQRAADFSWENTARQTLAVYREVAAKT
jgi:glycosyltransferase involved in cell wall biosynthesis